MSWRQSPTTQTKTLTSSINYIKSFDFQDKNNILFIYQFKGKSSPLIESTNNIDN